MNKVRAYCELVRLPNVFTAMADILAGYWLLSHEFDFSPTLGWLLLSSASLYSAGIVFNDLNDIDADRRERPSRPLPSGRVTLRSARMLGIGLALAGLAAAAFAGREMSLSFRHPASVAIVLLGAIVLYDYVLKPTLLGPVNMGICRALNLLLGASAGSAAQLGQAPPHLVTLALCVLVYVASITAIARAEVGGGRRSKLWPPVIGIVLAILLIGGLSIAAGDYSDFTLILWLALAVHLGRVSLRMIRFPTPALVQYAVKTYIMGIVVLDAVIASSAHGWRAGLAVLALLTPALLLGRWIYST
jgi:UbiA prenyltransferase family protein